MLLLTIAQVQYPEKTIEMLMSFLSKSIFIFHYCPLLIYYPYIMVQHIVNRWINILNRNESDLLSNVQEHM